MLFILLASIEGIFRCRFWSYWRWVVYAMAVSALGTLLISANGTLEDPRGSGFLTRWVVSATNDGPGVGAYAILALIVLYGGILYLLSRAWKVAKAHKAAVAAGEFVEDEEVKVPTPRKILECFGIVAGMAVWFVVGSEILQIGGPAAAQPVVVPTDVSEAPATAEATPPDHVPDAVAMDLQATVVSMNEKNPKPVDKVTTLKSVSSEGRTFTYHYQVGIPYQSRAYFIAKTKAGIIPKVCGNPAMRKDLDANRITYEYEYAFPDQFKPIVISVDSAACNAK